jgi:acetyl-CoA carboxylase biotin carboxyl carrier protein
MSEKRNSPIRKMKRTPPRAPTYDDILAIARLIESGSRFSEFRLRSGDIEVDVKRGNGAAGEAVTPAQAGAQLDPGPSPSRASGMTETNVPPGTEIVRSPMVGTFYRASDPGAPPFVEVGSRVAPDTLLCIIEVMKLMNSVTAGVAGVVTHVFVENAQMVEYGQPLIAVKAKK